MDPWSFQINRLNFEQLPPPLDYRAQQKNEQDAEQRGEQKIEGSIAQSPRIKITRSTLH